jgi:cation transport ATPase
MAPTSDFAEARVRLEALPGVRMARAAPQASSVTVIYDGRQATRRQILARLEALPEHALPSDLPARRSETLPLGAPLVAASLAPMLPPVARSAVAIGLVASKAVADWRRNAQLTIAALDWIALATTALTGHPLTTTTSLALGALAQRRRDGMLREVDRLLAHLVPAPAAHYGIERAGETLTVPPGAIEPGDRIWLAPGQVIPADGIVVEGEAEIAAPRLSALPDETVRGGCRVVSGARVLSGRIEVRAERPASRSRSARLRDHVQHIVRTREVPGPLTPDLERLVAFPITAAGLVLALTGDPDRTASMLLADPQMGIALAQPVAREAALYATARHGVLLSGLDVLDRLATAENFAFEDIGVLAEPHWFVEQVTPHAAHVTARHARRWLALLAGSDERALESAGLPDELVAAWRQYGALLRDGGRTLHIGGAVLVARTWNLPLREPDRRSLVRRLGIVEDGRLLATIHVGCRVRPGVPEQLAQLRRRGVRRIAIFTEDPTAQPAGALMQLGADVVVSESRAAQERRLNQAVERGERVALVHTGLRDLLPPGGLSLCPVDSDAGTHGILLGDPLLSLLGARDAAMEIRRELRRRLGRSTALNAGLMVAAAMRWLPPIATASLRHGLAFWLLQESGRLARLRVGPPLQPPEAPARSR